MAPRNSINRRRSLLRQGLGLATPFLNLTAEQQWAYAHQTSVEAAAEIAIFPVGKNRNKSHHCHQSLWRREHPQATKRETRGDEGQAPVQEIAGSSAVQAPGPSQCMAELGELTARELVIWHHQRQLLSRQTYQTARLPGDIEDSIV